MTKRVNSLSMALWWAAVIYTIYDAAMAYAVYGSRPAGLALHGLAGAAMEALWGMVRAAVTGVQLFVLGMLIELVDQIRWNFLPPDERRPFGIREVLHHMRRGSSAD